MRVVGVCVAGGSGAALGGASRVLVVPGFAFGSGGEGGKRERKRKREWWGFGRQWAAGAGEKTVREGREKERRKRESAIRILQPLE